jgi:hypothetical protein
VENRALLTRSLSRGVVSNCFGSSKISSSLAIVGSPGMGKSWTLLYALQQALLYDGACVMFIQQNRKTAYLCLRKDHLIYVWVAIGKQYLVNSVLFGSEEVLVLLDPVEAKMGGADYSEGDRMLIFAASNNEKHFENGLFKAQSKALRYLSPWSEEELRVGLPRMQTNLDLELALRRAQDVGMLPRYLLDGDKYQERNQQLDDAVLELSKNPSQLEEVLRFRGMETESHHIPGTMFAVFSNVKKPDDDVQDGRLPGCTYDGQFGAVYTEKRLGIMSDKVKTEIVKKNRDTILTFWMKVDSGKLSSMGQAVEHLFWDDLSSPEDGSREMNQWKLIGGADALQEPNFILTTPSMHVSDQKFDNIKSILESESTVARMENNCKLIDFAGPGHKVYQVTVSSDRYFDPTHMKDLLIQLGYLEQDGDKLCPVDANATSKDPLEFYWVVPYVWKRKRPKTIVLGKDKKNRVLKACVDTNVHQYVLIMKKQEKKKAK